ncbi:MAG TPA: hydrogenase formation protein HypD [Clostridia bacterium]|nr:hydrogenase formation protein HypD [Clostridia bacterium]
MHENKKLLKAMQHLADKSGRGKIRLMEVCGTHTQCIAQSGIKHLLPKNVQMLSGPGCPVCVTAESFIDLALEMLSIENTVIATFGDMLKVKGSKYSLADKIQNENVVTVYSPEDAIKRAIKNKDKTIIFLCVGFETTAPLYASMIKAVYEMGLNNLCFLTALKRMEPVLKLILEDGRNCIEGLICPGHVATITGADYFRFIAEKYKTPAVISGFESLDITCAILMLLRQISGETSISMQNLYVGCVSDRGNEIAQKEIQDVFDVDDTVWRAIGMVKNSALVINKKYKSFDAKARFCLKENTTIKRCECICSEIILGIKSPEQCHLFGKGCTPDSSVGPCMVSSEGACRVKYRFGGM